MKQCLRFEWSNFEIRRTPHLKNIKESLCTQHVRLPLTASSWSLDAELCCSFPPITPAWLQRVRSQVTALNDLANKSHVQRCFLAFLEAVTFQLQLFYLTQGENSWGHQNLLWDQHNLQRICCLSKEHTELISTKLIMEGWNNCQQMSCLKLVCSYSNCVILTDTAPSRNLPASGSATTSKGLIGLEPAGSEQIPLSKYCLSDVWTPTSWDGAKAVNSWKEGDLIRSSRES